jgi:hypothetical protein
MNFVSKSYISMKAQNRLLFNQFRSGEIEERINEFKAVLYKFLPYYRQGIDHRVQKYFHLRI